MNRTRAATVWAPALAAIGLVALVPAAAHAAVAWDGTNPLVGPADSIRAKFFANSFFFKFEDFDLSEGGPFEPNTDAFDDFGVVTIVSDSLGLTGTPYDFILGTGENYDQWVGCGDDPAAISVEEDPSTGDVTLSCTAINPELAGAGLEVDLEFRVFADGTTVRSMVSITNLGTADVVLDDVIIETEFGSDGQVIAVGGRGSDAASVPLPLQEDVNVSVADTLNAASADWIVHDDFDTGPSGAADWPAAVVIGGGPTAAAEARWLATWMDVYLSTVSDLSLPAGETRSIVSFAVVAPEPLLGIGFNNAGGAFPTQLTESAEQLTAGMGRFDQLDGRLADGIADTSLVVNWPEPSETPAEPAQPELADTGANDGTLLSALVALVLVLVGTAAILIPQRFGRRRA